MLTNSAPINAFFGGGGGVGWDRGGRMRTGVQAFTLGGGWVTLITQGKGILTIYYTYLW